MDFRYADIVFFNPVPVLSEILKIAQRCPWSHSAIATGHGTEVIGAEAEGIVRREMTLRELGDFAVLRHPGLSFRRGERVVAWALSKEGSKYDIKQLLIGFPLEIDISTPGKYTCTQFVRLAFLSQQFEIVQRIPPARTEPVHIWVQSNMRQIMIIRPSYKPSEMIVLWFRHISQKWARIIKWKRKAI